MRVPSSVRLLALALALATATVVAGCVSAPLPPPELTAATPAERAQKEAIRAEGREMFEELLTLSREADPDTDPACARALFATLVDDAREGMAAARTPRERVNALNAAFFAEAKFRPIADATMTRFEATVDPSKNGLTESRFLLPQRVLETKQGYCLSFAALYVALAAEFGVRASVVRVPRHVFVRVEDGGESVNVELLREGRSYDDDFYRRYYLVPKALVAKGYHMTSLREPRKVAALFWSNLAVVAFGRGDHAVGRARLARFEAEYPGDSLVPFMHGMLAVVEGRVDEGRRAFGRALALEPEQGSSNFALGLLAYERGDWALARPYFEKAYRGGLVQAADYAALVHLTRAPGSVPDALSLPPPADDPGAPTWTWPNGGKHYAIASPGALYVALGAEEGSAGVAKVVVDRATLPAAHDLAAVVEGVKHYVRQTYPASGTEELALPGCAFVFRVAVEGTAIDSCTRVLRHPKRPEVIVAAMLTAPRASFTRHVPAFTALVDQLEASLARQ